MNKLTAALFSALIALFIVGCGDPGEMDDVMEDTQQQQDGMEQQDGMDGGMDDGMDSGMDDDMGGGMDDDTYGDDQQQGDQEW